MQMRTELEAQRDGVPGWGWWGGWGGRGWLERSVAAGGPQSGHSEAGPTNVTTTNTQVAGVDEADFVKNDGTRIFVLSGNKLLRVASWPATNLSLQGTLKIEGWPREMFLDGDDRSSSSAASTGAAALERRRRRAARGIDCGYYYSNTVKVTVVDVSDLANLKVDARVLPARHVRQQPPHRRLGARGAERRRFNFPPGVQWWPEATRAGLLGWDSPCKPADRRSATRLRRSDREERAAHSRARRWPSGCRRAAWCKDGRPTILPPDCSSLQQGERARRAWASCRSRR